MTGWKIDIMSETRAAEAELDELTGGGSSAEDSEEAGDAVELYSAMSAKDAVAAIKSSESLEEMTTMAEGEKRVTVLRAFETRTAELTEAESAE